MQPQTLLALAVIVASSVPTDASAQESFTQEACVAHLTTSPTGPRLNPSNVPIGTLVFGEPVFSGMRLDYMCEREVRLRTALALAQGKAVQAQERAEQWRQAGLADAKLRTEVESNLIRSHPFETAFVSVATGMLGRGPIIFLLKFIAGITMDFLYLMYFGKRRRRSGFSRGTGSGRIHTK